MGNGTWDKPSSPPPPLFLGQKERNYTKQVNDEVIERMVGQQILYYSVNINKTDFHPVYGEAIEKSFYKPMHVHALINFEGTETATKNYGLDKNARISIGFHKRRLTEDKDLYVREGDFVSYGDRFYELVKVGEPKELFGQPDHRFEITALAVVSRKGNFDSR